MMRYGAGHIGLANRPQSMNGWVEDTIAKATAMIEQAKQQEAQLQAQAAQAEQLAAQAAAAEAAAAQQDAASTPIGSVLKSVPITYWVGGAVVIGGLIYLANKKK